MPLYARFGVKHLWLIDPLARTLEAFELREGRWSLVEIFKDEETVTARLRRRAVLAGGALAVSMTNPAIVTRKRK